MRANIVKESCRILFQSSIKPGEILARRFYKNFTQKQSDFKSFEEKLNL
jgi:hypothetical protein